MVVVEDVDVGSSTGKPPGRFPPYNRWDRNAVLVGLGLTWLGILMGFVPDVIRHVTHHRPPYPLIVHVHALFYVGWMALLTTQITLVRSGNTALHKRLGLIAAPWAAAMLVLGPMAAILVERAALGTPNSDPSFLSIQLLSMIGFGGMVAAALILRKDSAAHKRLLLLATLDISSAGFSRWLGDPLEKLWGDGFFGTMGQMYLGSDLVILVMGAYDLITRRRLHPAYVIGASVILVDQALAVGLYLSPAWKPVALKIIGH